MHSQSPNLNTNDPVAMHLLMETAMVDSKAFEILSFEEVEELKRERASLQNRIEATRRKLALETKLRDAAQSLNRLYSPKGKRESDETMTDGSPGSPKKTRRSLVGSRPSSSDVLSGTDDEFAASNRRCDELAQELSAMEKRSEDLATRILEHTAGILQLTHKGLKKNVRGEALPRSPESMTSGNRRSMAHFDGLGDFDDRSLYKSPDYFADYGGGNRKAELEMLEKTEKQLDDVNNRLRGMVLQADPNQQIDPPPHKSNAETVQQSGAQIQAGLEYLVQALESMEAAQARTIQDAQRSVYDSEDQMEDINLRLHDMLQRTNHVTQSPVAIAPDSRGKSLQSQLSFSNMVLERLGQRVEHLVEQKEILSRQVQQQRELNSKSDAQRDAQIMELTNELSDAKRQHALQEKEAESASNQIHLLMEQLDSSRQESVLVDQKRQSEDKKVVQAEKAARKRAEDSLNQLKRTMQAEKESRKKLEESLTQLKGTLQTERESKKQVEESLTQSKRMLQTEKESKKQVENSLAQLKGTLQAEKDSRKRADDAVTKLQGTIQAEKEARRRAEESLAKVQGTLQAGSDAQRQNNDKISELQASVQAERDGRGRADERLAQLQGLLQQEKNARRHADDTLTQIQETLQAEKEAGRSLEAQLAEVQGDLDEAKIDKAQAEAEVEKCRKEVGELESSVVRLQTDLTVVRAELDGAYGTRAQRAADVTMNPAVQKEIDDLNDKNTSLRNEINYLKTQGSGDRELKEQVDMLQKELKETIEDYELMTKASIEFEKDREQLERSVDTLREKCEALEAQLNDERVKWLGMKSPGVHGPGIPSENTSTMVLKNEFKKMMRDTRAENMKALKVRGNLPVIPDHTANYGTSG